jgi:uncharacterized protein YndB with AHSA1/START domain
MSDSFNLSPIRARTYINAPPERVYYMLTTGFEWDAWFTQGTQIDPQPEGHILFRWIDWAVDHYTCESDGLIIEAIPSERFVFQWTPGDSTTTVAFDLKSLGPGPGRTCRMRGRLG